MVVRSVKSIGGASSILTDFTRFYILLLLFEGQEHGYKIMRTLSGRLGHEVSPSLVYPFLKLLENEGYVGSRIEPSGRRKRKNVYSLTKEGRSFCKDLFKQFTTIVSSAIEGSMRKCAHCGCSVYKDAYMEEIRGTSVAFCCRYCAASYKRSGKSRREI